MIDMMADQIPDVPRKAARKQAMAHAGDHDGHAGAVPHRRHGEFSDEILASGREAALDARGGEAGREESPREAELDDDSLASRP